LPGRSFAYFTNSGTVRTGSSALTTSSSGLIVHSVIGTKSFTGS
jgi:hypothetical protein